jgi:hypothetical protein
MPCVPRGLEAGEAGDAMKPLDEALADLEKAVTATPFDQSPGATPHPPPPCSKRIFRDADGRMARIEVTYPTLGVIVTKTIVRNADHQMAAIHEETTGTDTGTAKRGVSKFDDMLVGLRKRSAELRAEDKVRKDEAIAKIFFKSRGYLTKFLDGTGVSWLDLVHLYTGRLSVERAAVVKWAALDAFRGRRPS